MKRYATRLTVGVLSFYLLLLGSALLLDSFGWHWGNIGRVIGVSSYTMWFYFVFGEKLLPPKW